MDAENLDLLQSEINSHQNLPKKNNENLLAVTLKKSFYNKDDASAGRLTKIARDKTSRNISENSQLIHDVSYRKSIYNHRKNSVYKNVEIH